MSPGRVRGLPLFLLVGAGYAVGSQLAYSWFGADGVNASFFPAAGVTLGALVLTERRQWWIVLLAAAIAEFALDIAHDLGPAASAGYVVANVVQPLVGALLLTGAMSSLDIGRTRDLASFFVFGVIVAPAVGGALGATTFVLDGGEGWARFAGEWLVGDGLGVLVVGGALVSLRASGRPLARRRAAEGAVLALVAVVSAALVFRADWFALVYVPVGLLMIVAFRVGTTGVALTGAALAFIAAESTAEGHRLWQSLGIEPTTGLLYLQLGIGLAVGSALVLAAEIAQRESAASALGRAEMEQRTAEERAALFDAERAARERAELLERNASQLVTTETVREVAEAVISDVGFFGMEQALFGVVDGERVAVAAASQLALPMVQTHPHFALKGSTVMAETARTGATIVANSGEEIDRRFPDARLLRTNTKTESILGAPLRAGDGRILGALVVTSQEANAFDTARRQLIEAVAKQAGVALDRAQLQEIAQVAAAHAHTLVMLGDALERETTVEGRVRQLVDFLVPEHATFASVEVNRLTETALRAHAGEDDGAARSTTVQLRARGRRVGALTVGVPREKATRLGDLHLRDIASRAATAIDNTAQYEREREVSHALQVGLLGEPTTSRGEQMATAYLPGAAMLEVGGDWHDTFELPSGSIAFVVGDVVGHGLDAAMAMGQLRGAVRALAPIGDPSDLLRNLDVFVEAVPEATMATLAYVELDPALGSLRYAAAGHPPPLVASPDGTTRLLWDGRSAPLGATGPGERVEADDLLVPGDQLVLYTDGLIERRGDGLDVMFDRLLDAASRDGADSATQTVERILASMLDGEPQADDICVLAFHHVPVGRFRRHVPAAPGELAGLRHAIADWLADEDVDEESIRSVVLAVSEAAANAIEHGYGFDERGIVAVEVVLDTRGVLTTSVTDTGGWRPPRARSDRGRGLAIMRALMEEVVVDQRSEGTVVRMRLPAAARATR